MSQDESLDALDRRAASAVDALDRALGDVDPGSVPVEARRPRRWVPMLVAAAVAVVALVGAVLVVDDGDERGTVAGEPEPPDEADETGAGSTHLHLADPEAFGYEVSTATDGPSEPDGFRGDDGSATLQAPVDSDDPWAEVVFVSSGPMVDERGWSGEVVDVGGPEAVLQNFGPPSLGWRDGDSLHTITSARLDRGQLVSLARSAVAEGFDGTGALPGHRVLQDGSWGDIYPLHAFPYSTTDRAVIGYRDSSAEDGTGGFVLASGPGSEAQWRAPTVLAPVVARTTVAGHDALFTDYRPAEGASEVSWREDDGTIVRIAGPGDVREVLGRVVDSLEPIGEDDLAALVDAHPADESPPRIDLDHDEDHFIGSDDSFPDPSDESQLGADAVTVDGDEYQVAVVRQPRGAVSLQTYVESGDGGSGSGMAIADLGTTVLVQSGASMSADGETMVSDRLVAGVVPPDLSGLEIRERSTGAALDPMVLRTSPIEGSDHELLLAVVAGDPSSTRLEVVVRTAGGGEARYWI